MNATATRGRPRKPRLTEERVAFKPFTYTWAYDLWLQHEQIHWVHTEIPMQDDVKDWQNNLTKPQKNFLLQILRLFTQGDVDVAGAYVNNYLPNFPQPEIRMMLMGFAAREAMHIAAYSHLIETLGLPDSTYTQFLEYEAMAEKHEYFKSWEDKTSQDTIIQQMTAVSAFTEGMQLFSSFVMLLNFGRQGLMPGMTKIVTWSIIDESIHVEGMTTLFRTFIKENRNVWNDDLKRELYSIAEKMVELEDKFIDIAYEMGAMEGLTKDEMYQYIRYIADRRLIGLGLRGIFKVKKNPLPWVDEMVVAPSHSNFFEQQESSYAKGALSGSWGQVWAQHTKGKA